MSLKENEKCAKVLWDYHVVDSELEKADVIIGLGSYDVEVASYCSQLYFKGYAPLIVFSGKEGNWTSGKILDTEAKIFSDRAKSLGVPEDVILLEEEATNIGLNIEYSKKLLIDRGVEVEKVIVVTKPNTTRRAFATTEIKWPEVSIMTSSPRIKFLDFPTSVRTTEELIHEMVGDIQRIKLYAELGWQSTQEIPENVWNSYNKLISLGFTDHLIQN